LRHLAKTIAHRPRGSQAGFPTRNHSSSDREKAVAIALTLLDEKEHQNREADRHPEPA
jgi:hypothetical protein